MKILAVDTALACCSAAVFDSETARVLAETSTPMATGHAEAIAPMVRATMASAELKFAALDRIATTVGPGTFTGLRIGVSFARGLGLALRLPVIGVSTLRALSANVASNPEQLPIAVAIDARRGNLYFQLFGADLAPLDAPRICTLAEAAAGLKAGKYLVVGSAAQPLASAVEREDIDLIATDARETPNAAILARLASLDTPDALPPQPLYLRRPDAKPQALGDSIDISETSIDQAASISALHVQCFAEPWTERSIAELLSMPGVLVLVARSAHGDQLGFLIARSAADEGEILSIAVLPLYRHRHIGEELVEEAVRRLAARGVRHLHIEVAESNSAAVALYAKLGFERSGRRRAYYPRPDGRREDALAMVRALPIAPRHV
jgi:tRNA threonylcarbamoyladenosine biosynthesis protein TsaB